MKRSRLTHVGALAVLVAAAAGMTQAEATTLEPRNVAALAMAAQDIVVGTVSRVSEGRQGRLSYTQVEVDVSEVIQGAPARTLTFRQVGAIAPAGPANGRRYIGEIPGMPRYTPGESVILFLGRTSSLGFRATIGLQQGKFTVQAGNAVNETGNQGLFSSVPTGNATLTEKQKAMLATRQGGVHARTFIDFVRQGVQQRWWR